MNEKTLNYIEKKRRIMMDSYRYFDDPGKYDNKKRGRPRASAPETVKSAE